MPIFFRFPLNSKEAIIELFADCKFVMDYSGLSVTDEVNFLARLGPFATSSLKRSVASTT
jgi:hypothetical protein